MLALPVDLIFLAGRNSVQLPVQRFFALGRNVIPMHIHQGPFDCIQQHFRCAKPARPYGPVGIDRTQATQVGRTVDAHRMQPLC